MKCGGCVTRVQRLLEQEPDVQKVKVLATPCAALHNMQQYGSLGCNRCLVTLLPCHIRLSMPSNLD